MTIKEFKEMLNHYDENLNVLFWSYNRHDIDDCYREFSFIDSDNVETGKRIDICLSLPESE